MPRTLRNSKRRTVAAALDNDDNDNDTTLHQDSSSSKTSRLEKMQDEWAALGKEYDVAAPARSARGHLKRKVPKEQWKDRTRQRKLLEQADEETAAVPQQQLRRRLRGSKVAFDEQLIHDSLVFPRASRRNAKTNAEDDDQDDRKLPGVDDAAMSDDDDEDEDFVEGDEDEEDDEDDENDGDEEEDEEGGNDDDDAVGGRRPRIKSTKRKMGRSSAKRRVTTLRNFQSQRMAQRHGDAIAAHARGQPNEAIQLLKELAKDAPSAPQIYSSLGMVYEDMLNQSRKRAMLLSKGAVADEQQQGESQQPLPFNNTTTEADPANGDKPTAIDAKDDSIPDPFLAEQLDLAQKTYGSFHIAAILRKRDYRLWGRAADAGANVAAILSQAMLLPSIDAKVVAYHRSEKMRWLSEVLRDLKAADNLKPPGIDVPCKLAAMHMELGNLSEALTILTDLKNNNNNNNRSGRSEFQSSYKAWLLYADLMLRVGHECIQWNRGVRSNDNYMFRRWLRKYSEVFDWQERRLQALCLALEAAAGTQSTGAFIQWMKDRAYKNHAKANSTKQFNDEVHSPVSLEDNGDANASEHHEAEKELMRAKHRSEMEAFDKSTNDLDFASNSKAAKDRQADRDKLLEAHEDAVATLDSEYNGNEKSVASSEPPTDEVDEFASFQDSVPISASCQQVCKIASELMKHLHGLELFAGARLVGESVSHYFKERAKKHDKRAMAAKREKEWLERVSKPSFLLESYEEESSDGMSDVDNDSSRFLSDDDDLDNEDSLQLIESLRKGILPPELRVLYGLALIGEGGRNFLAGKCLEAIDDLEQESISWLTSGERETEASTEPFWYLFQRAMTEPLDRTAAYAFLADVLRKAKKESEWSVHFAPWFRRHLETLTSVGLKEQLMGLRGEVSPFVNFRKNQLLKIILAAASFDLDAVETPAKRSPVNRELIVTHDAERVNIAISVMKSLSEIFYIMWTVDNDGSLPPVCSEAVKSGSRCLQWLAKEGTARLSYHQLHTVLGYANTLLSFLCGNFASLPDFKNDAEIALLDDRHWGHFPVKADWLAPEYRHVSLRAYNLTVACNVSLFSGWEPEEFTLQLLRRRHGHRHFGVHLRDGRVTGFLPLGMEEEIGRQWDMLRTLLPSFPEVRFRERLEEVKDAEWYKTEVEDRKKMLEGTDIARYAEDAAEMLYLAFSALCLQLAGSEENPKTRNRLLHASLSILLPVSQFCVDDRLWDSDIGEAASTLSSFDEWKLFNRIGLDAVMDRIEKKKTRWRRSAKVIERKVQEWIKGTEKPTLQSFVSLPLSEMRNVWFEGLKEPSREDKQAARVAMEKVHQSIKKLRGCYTEMACEKACLQISVKLLQLAAHPGCYDPFRCLQQAAMFATQACKAGNSDMSYRHKLPPKDECTPLQAMVILGRADCLHSVYFPNEAAFLCSYVALVCRMHRENENAETKNMEWNDQWKIVAIYAYNVSVMIRTTVSTVLDKQRQKSFLSMWDRDVVEELERGRADGWVWKRSLYGNGGLLTMPETTDIEDFAADEAENLLGDQDDSDNDEDGDEDVGMSKTAELMDRSNNNIAAGLLERAELESTFAAMSTLPSQMMTMPDLAIPDFMAAAPLHSTDRRHDEGEDDNYEGIMMVSV